MLQDRVKPARRGRAPTPVALCKLSWMLHEELEMSRLDVLQSQPTLVNVTSTSSMLKRTPCVTGTRAMRTFFCTGGGAVCAERHKSPRMN